MKTSVALLGAAARLGWGLVAPVPSPTDHAVGELDLYGVTPKPTTLALLHPGLAKRQGAGQSLIGYALPDNTCGYVSGSLGASKTCDTTQQCAAVQIGTIATMGCCDTVGDSCTWYGDCVNYSEYYSASECDQACKQDVNTVKCTSAAMPYCYPYLVPGISIGWYSCDSISRTQFDTFLSTFVGEQDGRTWSPLYDTASGSSTKIKPASAGSTGAFNTISVDGGSAATTGAATTSVNHGAASTAGGSSGTISKTKTNKTPIGAVVGGVIGGLAVIGGIIAGVVAMLMKKKKNKGTTPAATTFATNMNNAPPAGPDMRQSMYGQQPLPQGQYPQGQYPQGPYPVSQQQYPQQYPQQQFDPQNGGAPNAGFFAAAKFDQNGYAKQDGPQITEHSVPVTPMPPTSPAPPYVQPVQQGHESWNQTPVSPPTQSPPPQMMQGAYQPPQQPQQPQAPAPVELGTNFGTPQRNAEGRPVYEAA